MNQAPTGCVTDTLQCEVVSSFEALEALEPEWNSLLDRTGQHSIFLQYEWMSSWWSVFATDRHTLSVLLIRTSPMHGNKLVGIAPFQLIKSIKPVDPKLCFVGAGEPKDSEVVSEYLDLFALPEFESAVVKLVSDWIGNNPAWSSFECRDFAESALIYQVVHQLNTTYPGRLRKERWSFGIPLRTDTKLLDRLTPSRRKRLERTIRAIEREDELVRAEAHSADTLARHFSILKDLHKERWNSQGKNSIFDDDRFTQFHEQVLDKLYPQGLANITVFSMGDKPVAALYLYFSDSTVYYYQSGFKTENANRFMPLSNAHRIEIEQQALLGRTQYDFMRGEDDSYKAEFGCDKMQLYYARVHRHKGHFVAVNIKDQLRRSVGRLLQLFS